MKNEYKKIKNILDIIIVIILIIPATLLCIILGILIKIDSKGSVIYKHRRIGKNGKPIYIYKLRTMVNEAEQLMKEFTPEQKEEFKQKYKLENDPRITRIGKKIRKLSLDELPQLLNVLKGELSIVGPRPITEEELELYGKDKKQLLSVKPGIIGAWTANGRNTVSYEKRKKLELEYTKNITLKNDLRITIKTIEIVLKRTGAM